MIGCTMSNRRSMIRSALVVLALHFVTPADFAWAAVHYHVPSRESGSCGPFLPKLTRQDVVSMKKYFPLEKYRKFPAHLRHLFQRAESEQDTCRGLPDADAIQDIILMQSCNRAQRAYFLLAQKGWCWGGSITSSEQHWIKCDPGAQNGNRGQRYEGDAFTARDFRRALRTLHPHGPLPPVCPI